MVLLAGATGALGSAIADRLLLDKRAVRVLVRNPAKVAALVARGVEVAVGDATRRDTLDAAMHDVTHVITTVNAFLARSRRALEAVDLHGNRNLVDAARQAGVRKFVFTSAWLPEPYYAIDAAVVGPFNPAFARQVKAGALMASVPQEVPHERLGRGRMRLEAWAARSLIADR
jgi:uncharacterized protein YbjT (DUF2867 family)